MIVKIVEFFKFFIFTIIITLYNWRYSFKFIGFFYLLFFELLRIRIFYYYYYDIFLKLLFGILFYFYFI